MVLSDELFEKGKSSKEVCTIIDDDYVLVTKSAPVVDKDIDEYVDNIKRAKKSGINIAAILDYRFIPGTTIYFDSNNISFSRGVFLEERAKGVSLSSYYLYYDSLKDDNINELAIQYLNSLEEYVREIEKRSNGSQQVYDKFVIDCIKVKKYGIEIDPKPLNFFYDEDNGFTIIDVISKRDNSSMVSPYFPKFIFGIVYGYGRPVVMVDCNFFQGIPKEYSDRLRKAYQVIDAKIVAALRKAKVKENDIRVAIEGEANKYTTLDDIVEICDIETRLSELIGKNKSKLNDSFMLTIN